VKWIIFKEFAHIHEIEEPEISNDLEEIYKEGLNKINPNMRYVFDGYENILNEYFERHNPKLADLFISCVLGQKQNYFKQDRTVKEMLLSKFHGNPNYRIFDVDRGFIKLRRMTNKDAVGVMRNIISDIVKIYGYEKIEDLIGRFEEVEKNLQEARKEYGISQNIPTNPLSTNLTDFAAIRKKEKLKEKVYGVAPLY